MVFKYILVSAFYYRFCNGLTMTKTTNLSGAATANISIIAYDSLEVCPEHVSEVPSPSCVCHGYVWLVLELPHRVLFASFTQICAAHTR